MLGIYDYLDIVSRSRFLPGFVERATCVHKGVHLQSKVAVEAISQLVAGLLVRIASNEVIMALLTRVEGR